MNYEFNIITDFSHEPRCISRNDSKSSAECLREDHLKPILKSLNEGDSLTIYLDDKDETFEEGYASNYLKHAFLEIVKDGTMTIEKFQSMVEFKAYSEMNQFFVKTIYRYIEDLKNES